MVQLPRDAADVGRQEGRRARRRSRPACSAIRCCAPTRTASSSRRCMNEMGAFGVPIEGLHTETGPGVYEAAILFSEALEAADRAILFKTGAKEIGARFGIMPSFMAKWNAQLPGCSGHIHQSLSDGKKNLFYDAEGPQRHEQALRELPRRAGGGADGVRTDVLADDQQLQAPRRRLLGAGQADLGRRQSHRELSRDRGLAQVDAARNALSRRRREPVSRDGRGASPPDLHGVEQEPEAHRQADPRAPTRAPRTFRARRAR